jgi:anaerobic selenocysteine-containing dehydrogenase
MPELRQFTCNLCEALCGLNVTVDNNRVTEIRPDPDDVFSRGHICPKGAALRDVLEDPDRLRTPVRRAPNSKSGWEPISWDEAFAEVGARLRAIRAEHGKDAVALYIGNPTVHSHRASLGSQALAAALGTRNKYDANSQDSNPKLFACMQVYGDGLSISIPDVDRTDFMLILGGNPAASNGSIMSLGDVRGRLRGIRERGGRIVLVDPRRTETAAWCDEHHFIRPGGDAALLLALLHELFKSGRVDEARVEKVASGLGDLRNLAARFSPERVAPAIGMDAATIRALAAELGRAPRSVVYARVGVCQNDFGPVASWLVEAINVVTGNFDREGGAMFGSPAADVGSLARLLIGNHYGRWRSRVRGLPEFLGTLPSAVLAEEMETPGAGQIRAFVTLAGNPVLSVPNGERLGRALAGLDYMVAVDFYINETTRYANIILPPTHVLESGNYDLVLLTLAVRNYAKYSAAVVKPPDGARDDWEICSELALRIAGPDVGLFQRAARRLLRDAPNRVVDWIRRLGRSKLTLARLRELPHGIDLGPLVPSRKRKVRTPDGLVRLYPEVYRADVPRLDAWVDAGRVGGLVLIGRRHLRSNNSWMHNVRSLVKGPDRTHLLMHPGDAAARRLTDGTRVRVRSRVGEVAARVTITDEIMAGVVSLPHGFGHQSAQATMKIAGAIDAPNANGLTDEALIEPLIGNSILNGVPVTVEAHEPS